MAHQGGYRRCVGGPPAIRPGLQYAIRMRTPQLNPCLAQGAIRPGVRCANRMRTA